MKASEFTRYLLDMVKDGCLYVWGGQGQFASLLTTSEIINAETSTKNAARVFRLLASRLDAGYDYKKMRVFDCSGLGVYWFTQQGLISYDMTADGLYKMCKYIPMSDIKEGDQVYIVSFGRDLKLTNPKMTGSDVKELQKALKKLGYDCGKIDGEFGEKCDKAVRQLQKDYKLTVDGIAGPNTKAVLRCGKATHVGYCIGDKKIVESAGRDLGVVCRDVSKNTWSCAGRPDFWR